MEFVLNVVETQSGPPEPPDGAAAPHPPRWRRLVVPLAVFAACLAAYLCVGRSGGSGDTLPARLVAISLLTEGNFDLDEFGFTRDERAVSRFPQMGGVPYYLRMKDDSYYSAYSVAPAVLALPVFAPFVLAGLDPASPRAAFVEKLAASLMVALSAALLFVVLRRHTGLGWSLFLAAVYAFGTSSFHTSSQALWQHGPGQLCLTLAVLWLDPAGKPRPVLSALALGAAVAVRSTNALVALPLGLWLLWNHRDRWWKLGLAAAPCPALLLAYYLAVFGAPGPVAEDIHMGLTSGFRQIPLLEGAWGVLASPMRGLFHHSPIFVLALAGLALAARRRDRHFVVLGLGALLVVPLAAKWFMWWGGHCFGPRLLADAMPLWVLALVPALRLDGWPGRLLRGTALALGALSIGIGTLGAARYDGRHDAYVFTDQNYENLLRPGGGPVAFYLTDLLADWGLREGPPTDLGPPPARPGTDPDGRPLPMLGNSAGGSALLRAVISGPFTPKPDAPVIDIRFGVSGLTAGQPLDVEIRTLNPARPHTMNGWVIIEDATGGLWNLQRDRFVPAGMMPPKPWTGNSPLPYDVRIRLKASVPALPQGEHRLNFVLTNSRNTMVEGRGSAVFETVP
jgi:hypothetical protein